MHAFMLLLVLLLLVAISRVVLETKFRIGKMRKERRREGNR